MPMETQEWGDFGCMLVPSDIRALIESRDERNNDIWGHHCTTQQRKTASFQLKRLDENLLNLAHISEKLFVWGSSLQIKHGLTQTEIIQHSMRHIGFNNESTASGHLPGAGNDMDLHLQRPLVIPSQISSVIIPPCPPGHPAVTWPSHCFHCEWDEARRKGDTKELNTEKIPLLNPPECFAYSS